LRPKKEEEGNGRGGWLGVTTRTVDGRLLAAQVLADGPGEAAGIAPGDEIVAVGGFRVDEKGPSGRLAARRPRGEGKGGGGAARGGRDAGREADDVGDRPRRRGGRGGEGAARGVAGRIGVTRRPWTA